MMETKIESDDITSQFLQHQGESYLLTSGGSVDGDTEDSRDGEEERSTGVLREQDRFLPIANVARLMKKVIPKTGKIAKDARECVQECVSEFVSFITSEASDRCHQEKRKTINGEDILVAMTTLGFDNYVEPLKLYLQKYREANKGEKGISLGESSILSPGSTSSSASTPVAIAGGAPQAITISTTSTPHPPGSTVVFTYSDGTSTTQTTQPGGGGAGQTFIQ